MVCFCGFYWRCVGVCDGYMDGVGLWLYVQFWLCGWYGCLGVCISVGRWCMGMGMDSVGVGDVGVWILCVVCGVLLWVYDWCGFMVFVGWVCWWCGFCMCVGLCFV